jgi:hypothetical protein
MILRRQVVLFAQYHTIKSYYRIFRKYNLPLIYSLNKSGKKDHKYVMKSSYATILIRNPSLSGAAVWRGSLVSALRVSSAFFLCVSRASSDGARSVTLLGASSGLLEVLICIG